MVWWKAEFLVCCPTPVSKEVAESYNKRISDFAKTDCKQNCDIDSLKKKLVGEYGFVMKQLAQIKKKKAL